MTEQTDKPISVTDPYQVPVTFVNEVVGSGFLNGNINLTLATARFTPIAGKVEHDIVITSRLRMDLFCAMQLRDELSRIIAGQTKTTGAN